MFAFKTRKSNGVRVTPAVHRLIGQGNAARDLRRWEQAADLFGAALAGNPTLGHVHVQRGHALRELGRLDEAAVAYAAAVRLRPDDGEAVLHSATLAERREGPHAAARLLVEAVRRDPGHAGLERALVARLGPVPPPSSTLLHEALREGAATGAPAGAAAPASGRIFDITDLVGHFRHHRLPNGIERVQMEVLGRALDRHGDDGVGLCCFTGARDGWVAVPPPLFRDLAALATTEGEADDPDWVRARLRLLLHLIQADPYLPPPGCTLVNLGTCWWVHGYFRHLRNARAATGLRYVPMVYDLIPLLAPGFCLPGVRRDFLGWLVGALRHADGFVAISGHSRDDLLRAADRLGLPLPTDRVEVVPLDADFRRPVPAPAAVDPADAGLAAGGFALLVSTIEPRKNHALAFDAWSDLLRRHGPDRVPRLVCVGRDGWLNDAVFARLTLDPLLAAHVTLIPRVSDDRLAFLYRACRFTVYPSLYEGWGLPVTEALSHGRVAVVADSSSLPEAAGDAALLFASGSTDALVRAVERVAFDGRWRTEREAAIARDFHPRGWAEIADQVEGAVSRMIRPAEPDAAVPAVPVGVYYPVRLHHEDRLPAALVGGEALCVGSGWLWPQPDGCRTTAGGGALRFRVPGRTALRLLLRVRGLASADCEASVAVAGETRARQAIPAGKIRWLACDVAGPEIALVLRGDHTETVDMANGTQVGSVALLGLIVADPDAPAAALLGQIDRAGSVADD